MNADPAMQLPPNRWRFRWPKFGSAREPGFLIFALAMLCGFSAPALEIKEVRWGFDGKVVPNHFAILSLLVQNPGSAPFDGELILEQSQGVGSPAGAPIVQPVYLAPNSARFVQFQPYALENSGGYSLRWGRGPKNRADIDGPNRAGPARVFLLDPENPFAAATKLRGFPDDLFPTTVGATDGLDAVVLDHAPRWEMARREAFLDWLRCGGTVHLVLGAKGTLPEFSNELAILNGPGERTRLGAGTILRHQINRTDVTDAFLDQHGSPARELRNGKKVSLYAFDLSLLQKLAALTKPHIVWWLIYLLTGSYILVVGPVHFLVGRKIDYRLSIVAFVAVVAAYAASFAWAGRRGADETQRVHSVSIAHALGGQRYDVMQWISAFVTHGDLYKLTHDAASNLYTVGPSSDAVRGQIRNGRDGILAVDLPLYSSRPFMHRGVMRGDDTSVAVEQWETDANGKLIALTLLRNPAFPKSIEDTCLRVGDRFHEMKPNGDRWEMGTGESAETYFSKIAQDLNATFDSDESGKKDQGLKRSMRAFIARDLGGEDRLPQVISARPLAADQVQLFVFARAPEGFRLKGGDFKSEDGYVLYVQDIFRPNPTE